MPSTPTTPGHSNGHSHGGDPSQALKAWWANFKKKPKKDQAIGSTPAQKAVLRPLTGPPAEPAEASQGIFGVPLDVSIKYANVAISLMNEHGESFIYGYVPIVVAKCGVFLKEKGTASMHV